MLRALIEWPVLFGAGYALQWAMAMLAMLPTRRRRPRLHWTERARLGYSARLVIGAGPLTFVGIGIGLSIGRVPGMAGAMPRLMALSLGALCAGPWLLTRLLRRRVRWDDVLGDCAVQFLVRAPAVPVFIIMMFALAHRSPGWTSAAIMLGALAAAAALTLGVAFPLLRAVGLLRPAPRRAEEVVAATCSRMALPAPRVEVLQWQWANALAHVFSRRIAMTPSIIKLLGDRELGAVCAHEMGHLQESAPQKFARLSGLLVLFGLFTASFWSKRFGLPGLLIPLGAAFLAGRLLQRFARRMEQRADAHGHLDDDGRHLASALERLYQFNAVPAVMPGKRQIHPHLYDRLIAAGLPPAYPRPKPPAAWLGKFCLIVMAFLAVAIVALALRVFPPGEASAEARGPDAVEPAGM